MVREIYLAKIFFTDLSENKIRPVLIIKEMDEDVLCLQISTKIQRDRILITNEDLEEGILKKESVVIVPKNFTLNKKILIRKIGKLKNEKFKIVYDRFCKKLNCKEIS